MKLKERMLKAMPTFAKFIYLDYRRNKVIEESIMKKIEKNKNSLKGAKLFSQLIKKTLSIGYVEKLIQMDMDNTYRLYALGKLMDSPIEGYVVNAIEKNA